MNFLFGLSPEKSFSGLTLPVILSNPRNSMGWRDKYLWNLVRNRSKMVKNTFFLQCNCQHHVDPHRPITHPLWIHVAWAITRTFEYEIFQIMQGMAKWGMDFFKFNQCCNSQFHGYTRIHYVFNMGSCGKIVYSLWIHCGLKLHRVWHAVGPISRSEWLKSWIFKG